MVYIGMDVNRASTALCIFDPAGGPDGQHRFDTVPTGAEPFRSRLAAAGEVLLYNCLLGGSCGPSK